MNEQEQNAYINQLLDDPSAADLNEVGKDLLRKMKEARDEGNHALNMIAGIRAEIPKLQVQAENRQGRFDALSDLLIEEEENRQLKAAADAALAEEKAKATEAEKAADAPTEDPEPEVIPASLPLAPLPEPIDIEQDDTIDVLDSLDEFIDPPKPATAKTG